MQTYCYILYILSTKHVSFCTDNYICQRLYYLYLDISGLSSPVLHQTYNTPIHHFGAWTVTVTFLGTFFQGKPPLGQQNVPVLGNGHQTFPNVEVLRPLYHQIY